MHVTGEAIEFCNDDGTFRLASPRKRAAEFGAAIQSVGTLPGLDLDMLADEIDPFGLGEALDGGFLGLDPQSTLALSGRGNAVISDCVAHNGRPDSSRKLSDTRRLARPPPRRSSFYIRWLRTRTG